MEKLGVEPLPLLMQIFNFTIMVLVLGKLLYKPILNLLKERKRKIEEGLQYTEKMKEEMERSDKMRQDVINKAKDEARKIVEEGKKTGRKLEAEIIEKAQKEAKIIVEKGRKEVELERLLMEKELRKQTVDVSSHIVEVVLGSILDINTQRKIIERKIQELARHLK